MNLDEVEQADPRACDCNAMSDLFSAAHSVCVCYYDEPTESPEITSQGRRDYALDMYPAYAGTGHATNAKREQAQLCTIRLIGVSNAANRI